MTEPAGGPSARSARPSLETVVATGRRRRRRRPAVATARGKRPAPAARHPGARSAGRWRIAARRRSASASVFVVWISLRPRGNNALRASSRRPRPPGGPWPTCGPTAPSRPTLRRRSSACHRLRRSRSPSASCSASLIGTFASVESFLEPQIGFLRYIPATALTPLFLLWLGIGESPKIWLIVVGHRLLQHPDDRRRRPERPPRDAATRRTRSAPAGGTILRRVILPHSVPGIIDVARINLAAAWLMLVVAELLAAETGLAYRDQPGPALPGRRRDVRPADRLRRSSASSATCSSAGSATVVSPWAKA